MRQFICHADEGGGIYLYPNRYRTRADRRHNRPAPSSRSPYTATAAPGPGREDRAENTRRTGGRGPGRDFPKKNLCVSARRMARRKGQGVERFPGLSPPACSPGTGAPGRLDTGRRRRPSRRSLRRGRAVRSRLE